jgi:deoxyribodipyrimidine photo-lyase
MTPTRLVWLRNDLRITDNPALNHACRDRAPVVAVVTLVPQSWQEHGESPARMALWRDQLRAIAETLEQRNIPLKVVNAGHFKHCAARLLELAQALNADEISF